MPNVKRNLISLLACAVLAAGILGACAKSDKDLPPSSEPEDSTSGEISDAEDWELDIPEPEPELEEPEPEAPAVSASEASPDVSSEEESSIPEEPKTNPFSLSYNSLTDMYVLNPSAMVYNRPYTQIASLSAEGEKFPIIDAINALPRLSKYDYDKSVRYSTGFLFYNSQGGRLEYNIIPGALIVNGAGYYLPEENYEELMELAGQVTQDSGGAQWLVCMSPSYVTGIKCMDEDGNEFSVKKENLQNAVRTARNLSVSGVRTFQRGHYELAGMDGFYTQITFDTGVIFTMLMDGSYLYLESSDMNFGCRYDMGESAMKGFAAAMKQAAA